MSTDTIAAPAPARAGRGTPASTGGLGNPLLLRINPVPRRRLGAGELQALLRDFYAAQLRKHRLRGPACDQLYELAGRLSGKERHRVLMLRRAIYNDRSPGTAAATWPDAVAGWLAEHEAAGRAEAAVRAGYDGFLGAERSAMADAIGDESLQLGLALNAPQALDAVARYRHRADAPTARERKSERGIVQYLTRAMVRTSPLSWFTAIGFGVWSAAGIPLDSPRFDRRVARSAITVDRALFSNAITGLTPPVPGAVAAVLACNSTLRVTGTGVRFQRWAQGRIHLVETPLTQQLRVLLLVTQMGPLPAPVLAEQVALRLGVTAQAGARLAASAAAAQILVAGPAFDSQAADPLPPARDLLGPRHPGTALLSAMQREMTEVASGSVPRRRAALARLEVIGDRINQLSSRPAQMHLNEDVLLPTVAVTDRGYQAALHDLADVAELAHVFDPYLLTRCLLTAAFTDRFGVGGSATLVDCADDLGRDISARARLIKGGGREQWSQAGGEDLARLLTVREQARAAITGEIEAGRGEEEVWVPAGRLRALAAGLPDRLRDRPASYGLLVQPAGGRLVLNGCYSGHNLLGMRFLGKARHCGHAAVEEPGMAGTPLTGCVSERVRRLFGADGVTLLEDYGLHGSNLNHRVRLLPDLLTPADWLGISLVHDPRRDGLSLTMADGTPVRILYSGMRWIQTLPLPLRIAIWLTDSGHVALDPVGWARRVALRADHEGAPLTAGEPTSGYPRLVAGAVVISRRRWYPGSDFASALAVPDEAGRLLAITRWRAAHGVSEEVVVKTVRELGPDADPATVLDRYQRMRRQGKPQYADLASALMIRVLPRLLERHGPGFVEEALPGLSAGGHAFEWVIEYDRPPGCRFQAGRPPYPADSYLKEATDE